MFTLVRDREKDRNPIVQFPFPVPVPSPFPCSVTKPFKGLSEVPVSSYVTKLHMRPNMVTKEGVSGTKHFYWVPLYGTTVFFYRSTSNSRNPQGFLLEVNQTTRAASQPYTTSRSHCLTFEWLLTQHFRPLAHFLPLGLPSAESWEGSPASQVFTSFLSVHS